MGEPPRRTALTAMTTADAYDPHRLDDVVATYLPSWIRRMAHVGCGAGRLGERLKRERGIAVFGIEHDMEARTRAESVLDGVCTDETEHTARDLDCIYLPWPADERRVADTLHTLLPRLTPHGLVLLTIPNPRYWRRADAAGFQCLSPTALEALLAPLGLIPYLRWRIEDAAAAQCRVSGGVLWLEGRTFDAPSEQSRLDLITVDFLMLFSRADYDPLAHAHDQLTQGRPYAAYDILSQAPETYAKESDAVAAIAAEMQLCLLVMGRHEDEAARLGLFARAQHCFYKATGLVPDHPLAFECQARFWNLLGDESMAARLRRIYGQINAHAEVGERPDANTREPEIALPTADARRIRRVLMLTRSVPDFGLDVLYDGLCSELGAEHVVEFPFKPSLHGERPPVLAHYPCLFSHPGTTCSREDLLAQVGAGRFDLILYGAVDPWMDAEFLQALARSAPNTPWVLVDQRDESDDVRTGFHERLPSAPMTAYFKREWLHCAAWDGPVFPLPFGYPESLVPERVPCARTRAVFWAGHRIAGLRRAYLDHAGKSLGLVFPDRMSQDEYRAALLESRIGLNFFGFGFDTVRYWELPAHGCMLMANRLPIRIPYNFVDGESAVFFDDLYGLEEKLRHYLAHPDEADAIAAAGRAQFLAHHTGAARARQLLGAVAACIDSPR